MVIFFSALFVVSETFTRNFYISMTAVTFKEAQNVCLSYNSTWARLITNDDLTVAWKALNASGVWRAWFPLKKSRPSQHISLSLWKNSVIKEHLRFSSNRSIITQLPFNFSNIIFEAYSHQCIMVLPSGTGPRLDDTSCSDKKQVLCSSVESSGKENHTI